MGLSERRIADKRRLAAIESLGLAGDLPREALDRLTRLAARLLNAPLSTVSVITAEEHICQGAYGMGQERVPLERSFCRHVVETDEPLVVADARLEPRLRENPVIAEDGIIAYLGVPLRTSEGQTLGAFCVVDREPRVWNEDDVALVGELARTVMESLEHRQARDRQSDLLQVVEHAPTAMAVISAEGRWLSVNSLAASLLGRSPAELAGEPWVASVHAQDRPLAAEGLGSLLRGEVVNHQSDLRLQHPDGTLVWVHAAMTLTRGEAGEGDRVIAQFRDVTARKVADQAIAGRQRTMDAAERLSQFGWWSVAIGGGAIDFSPGMFRLLRHDPARGVPPRDQLYTHVHPEDLVRVGKVRARTIASLEPYEVEFRVIQEDGSFRILRSVGAQDPERPRYYIGTLQDVTELRSAELEASRRREQLEATVEAIRDGYLVTVDGVLTDVNDVLCEMVGYERDELVGRPLPPPFFVADGADTADVVPFADRVSRSEVTLRHRAGRTFPASLTSRIARLPSGEVYGTVSTLRDISAERKLEDDLRAAAEYERAASQTKSAFLANMSHEIRTPLNGVLGMLTLLADTPLSQDQAELLRIAQTSGEALLGVINDVLDLAKIESGRIELEEHEFDLTSLIEESCDMVAAAALTAGLELQSYVDPEVPRYVRSDSTRIRQILANLLSNAVKFTPEGEVVLEVVPAGDDVVRFVVRDTGIGIAPDRLEQLFEPFTQADAATNRRYGGTGLGLTISRELAGLLGGSISAASELGHGSTFTVELPLRGLSPPERARQEPAGLRGRRILVVDDHATNRRIFAAYVQSWGMESAEAPDAAAALSALRKADRDGSPFSVVLLDHQMPEVDGYSLARAIVAEPGLTTPKLILLTSSGLPGDGEGHSLFDARLTKPVRQKRLLEALETALRTPRRSEPGAGEAGAPASAGDSARILVVEDQLPNWMVIEQLLRRRGHQPLRAVDGERALERWRAEPFDLILMDCQLPGLDGYAATRALRAEEAGTGQHIPVVAMTANALAGDRERCLAAGMDDYISKPIRTAELDAALARWLPGDGEAAPGVVLDPARITALQELFAPAELAEVLAEARDTLQADIDELRRVLDGSGDGKSIREIRHRILNGAQLVGAQGALLPDGAAGEATLARWPAVREALQRQIDARSAGV